MAKIACQVRITGRVQGVFFRAWTLEQAERLDVVGWVRNSNDGSVEAHLEGPEQRVAEMVRLLKHGPSGARVDHLEFEEVKPEGKARFAVRR